MNRMARGIILLLLAGAGVLGLGRGTSVAADKPPVANTEPDTAMAWQRRIPDFVSDNLPLEELVNRLRRDFPELNFMAKPKARNESVTMILRSVTLDEILRAIEPATEGRVGVLWPTNNGDRLLIFDRPSQAVPLDPNTGLPFANSGKKICRVYNLSEYLKGFSDMDLDKATAGIQNVLETAWRMLRDANPDEDPALPTLSVHRGT